MSDFAQLKAGFLTWATTCLPAGTPLSYFGDPRGLEMKVPVRVELDGPHSISEVSDDEVVWVTVGQDVQAHIKAFRNAVLTVRAISRDNTGNSQAEFTLELLRAGLRRPATRQMLKDAGIAVNVAEATARYQVRTTDRWESVAAFEIRFGFAFESGITDIAQDTIDHTLIHAEISNVQSTFVTGILAVIPSDYVQFADSVTPLSPWRAVRTDGGSGVEYAQPTIPFGVVIGITKTAGTHVELAWQGVYTDPSWSWDLSLPILLGDDGALVQSLPSGSNILQVLGYPLTVHQLEVRIEPPVTL
jgi:hypothetical protein